MAKLMSQRIKAAIRAGVKPSTLNPGTILSTNKIKAALITKVKRPRVRMLIGKVRMMRIGLMMALMMPSTKATKRAVVKLSTLKPGTSCEVKRIVRAERSQFTRMLIF